MVNSIATRNVCNVQSVSHVHGRSRLGHVKQSNFFLASDWSEISLVKTKGSFGRHDCFMSVKAIFNFFFFMGKFLCFYSLLLQQRLCRIFCGREIGCSFDRKWDCGRR